MEHHCVPRKKALTLDHQASSLNSDHLLHHHLHHHHHNLMLNLKYQKAVYRLQRYYQLNNRKRNFQRDNHYTHQHAYPNEQLVPKRALQSLANQIEQVENLEITIHHLNYLRNLYIYYSNNYHLDQEYDKHRLHLHVVQKASVYHLCLDCFVLPHYYQRK